ncbi:MAG TPA: cellulase family glycosylhydrolase, partial [Tepidisphaeraceae bacterium]|nr:cellulase family glycosylhydrolase [Tepidisphaeraceae bacterium]
MTCLHQFDALRYWSLVWVVGLCAGVVSAEPEKGLPGLGIPESFGVNIHFTRADAKELAALQESGSRFVRMDFSWGGTERKKGEYDFSAYDGLVADMGKLGIRCLFILDYGNRLYDEGVSPHSAEAQGAFAKWAGAAAKHFAGKGVLWEIWNEPNIPQFWKPKPNAEDYSRLALATIEAVRAADANAFIMGPASSTFPWEFFETMGKNGVFARLDAASVHPYRQQIPETAE